jgi:hypothetical protein
MILDPVINKLSKLYIDGNIPTQDYRELTDMLEKAFIQRRRQEWKEEV